MNKKYNNPYYHLLYILFVIFILSLVFGLSWGSNAAAFYFICMLLPITLGTSYFFNYIIVPLYYLKRRIPQFILYTLYTVIISLYLQSIVLMFSLIYLGNFNFQNLAPNASDTILLAAVLYLLVLIGSFLLMVQQIQENHEKIQMLTKENEKMKKSFLEVMSKRKIKRISYDQILYIESLADYIKLHTIDDEIISKEKISKLADRLPDIFLRIHRSFIVNQEKISSFSNNEVFINTITLNIGRSYQKEVKRKLKGTAESV